MTAMGLVLGTGTGARKAGGHARGHLGLWRRAVRLTGKALFQSETVSDVIAAVLTRKFDWQLLPSDTPPGVRRLLRRCLERDVRRRLRDIGDARLELDDIAEPVRAGTGDAPRPAKTWLPWSLSAAAIAVAA